MLIQKNQFQLFFSLVLPILKKMDFFGQNMLQDEKASSFGQDGPQFLSMTGPVIPLCLQSPLAV